MDQVANLINKFSLSLSLSLSFHNAMRIQEKIW
jgi:hypothetical protein